MILERSFGPLYLAREELKVCAWPRRKPRPHVGRIIEMHEPWRRGRAITFVTNTHFSAVGIWLKDRSEIDPEFEDDRWLAPRRLDTVPPEVIANWGRGPDEKTLDEEIDAIIADL